jgi:hypothetical protein
MAFENIALPLEIAGIAKFVESLLAMVRLTDRIPLPNLRLTNPRGVSIKKNATRRIAIWQ